MRLDCTREHSHVIFEVGVESAGSKAGLPSPDGATPPGQISLRSAAIVPSDFFGGWHWSSVSFLLAYFLKSVANDRATTYEAPAVLRGGRPVRLVPLAKVVVDDGHRLEQPELPPHLAPVIIPPARRLS